ncbi:hypothetical protein [Ramlibacter algicola]|uniref:Uncharacterized protein n=1 Tax=Ramlibacter algicola TaxID=2795217 RepID=A0A934Q0X2_9BURK|nr:hypothetical protein [Ramlibacter algicola]MBK0392451.1 hypothetical protein [Ramlibacter algicola]
MTTNLPWADAARPLSSTLLRVLAALLHAASRHAARAAERAAAAAEAATPAIETVEFHELHRDSGAPEGALYVNGQLVAILPGVTRL